MHRRSRLHRVAITTLIVAPFVLLLGAGAMAAYPPAGSDAACDAVSTTTVTVSQSITVSGQAASGTKCFTGSSTVTIHFLQSDHIIATTTTDSSGNFSVTGNVPSTVHAGAAEVEALGTLNGSTQSYSTAVTVGSGSNLPKTGQDIALLVFWALVLIGIGTVLIRVFWRKKQRIAA